VETNRAVTIAPSFWHVPERFISHGRGAAEKQFPCRENGESEGPYGRFVRAGRLKARREADPMGNRVFLPARFDECVE
jgi:hypothetical protein